MKKNILYSIIALVLFSFAACEEYEGDTYDFSNTSPAYIELTDTRTQSAPEGGTLTFTVQMKELVYKDITVNYEISGDFSLNGDFTYTKDGGQQSFTVAVPEGVVAGQIAEATLKLTSASGEVACGRQVDGEGLDVEAGITVTKFCSLDDLSLFTGNYSCNEPGYGDYNVTFSTIDGEPNALMVDNFWDSGWQIKYVFSMDFDQTVTIPPQAQEVSGDAVTVSGEGKYDGCTGSFWVDYTVQRDSDGAFYDVNTHTFTKL